MNLIERLSRWWWSKRHPNVSYDNILVRADLRTVINRNERHLRVVNIDHKKRTVEVVSEGPPERTLKEILRDPPQLELHTANLDVPKDLVVCESMAAIVRHLRPLGPKGPCPRGGADTRSLCSLVVSWDLPMTLDQATCKACLHVYRDRQARSKLSIFSKVD